jgi:hypothetical protein
MAGAFRAALRGLLVLALWGVTCAPAGATACATAESVSAHIRRQSASAEIRIVGDPLASGIRAGISALVGQQVPTGGQYLVAHVPGTSTSYVVRFAGGCATHHGRFPRELLRAWLEGSPA